MKIFKKCSFGNPQPSRRILGWKVSQSNTWDRLVPRASRLGVCALRGPQRWWYLPSQALLGTGAGGSPRAQGDPWWPCVLLPSLRWLPAFLLSSSAPPCSWPFSRAIHADCPVVSTKPVGWRDVKLERTLGLPAQWFSSIGPRTEVGLGWTFLVYSQTGKKNGLFVCFSWIQMFSV